MSDNTDENKSPKSELELQLSPYNLSDNQTAQSLLAGETPVGFKRLITYTSQNEDIEVRELETEPTPIINLTSHQGLETAQCQTRFGLETKMNDPDLEKREHSGEFRASLPEIPDERERNSKNTF